VTLSGCADIAVGRMVKLHQLPSAAKLPDSLARAVSVSARMAERMIDPYPLLKIDIREQVPRPSVRYGSFRSTNAPIERIVPTAQTPPTSSTAG